MFIPIDMEIKGLLRTMSIIRKREDAGWPQWGLKFDISDSAVKTLHDHIIDQANKMLVAYTQGSRDRIEDSVAKIIDIRKRLKSHLKQAGSTAYVMNMDVMRSTLTSITKKLDEDPRFKQWAPFGLKFTDASSVQEFISDMSSDLAGRGQIGEPRGLVVTVLHDDQVSEAEIMKAAKRIDPGVVTAPVSGQTTSMSVSMSNLSSMPNIRAALKNVDPKAKVVKSPDTKMSLSVSSQPPVAAAMSPQRRRIEALIVQANKAQDYVTTDPTAHRANQLLVDMSHKVVALRENGKGYGDKRIVYNLLSDVLNANYYQPKPPTKDSIGKVIDALEKFKNYVTSQVFEKTAFTFKDLDALSEFIGQIRDDYGRGDGLHIGEPIGATVAIVHDHSVVDSGKLLQVAKSFDSKVKMTSGKATSLSQCIQASAKTQQPAAVKDAELRMIKQMGMPFPIAEDKQQWATDKFARGKPFEKSIPVSLLTATQRDFDPEKVQSMMHQDQEPEAIHVVHFQNRYVIPDGHHRAMAARFKGEGSVPALVVEA